DAFLQRARLFFRLGLPDLAALDFRETFALREPFVPLHWACFAALLRHVGDLDQYHRVRTRMRQRFEGDPDPDAALELAHVWALAPVADSDAAWLLGLAERVASGTPRNPRTLSAPGLPPSRAGGDGRPVNLLREAQPAGPDESSRALLPPVLALAHLRLNQPAEARQALDEAARALDQWAESVFTSE